MTSKNKNFENNHEKAVDMLSQKTEDLNLSNSEESYEEYTPREIEYIDRYKPMTLYRMEDHEIYDIIIRNNFNDEKIESEIREFAKLIKIKGDDYGWKIIDEGKKKKLYLNEKTKKESINNKNENSYKNYNSYSNRYNSYNNSYYTKNRNYNSNNYYNKNKNYYSKENENVQDYNSELTNTNQLEGNSNEEQKATNEETNNYYTNTYYSRNNYYSYNRGGRGKRGRGFNRGRGRYRNNNYSREEFVYEKELGKENAENNNEDNIENKIDENVDENENKENMEQLQNNNIQLEEDVQENENDNAEENFIEEEPEVEIKENKKEETNEVNIREKQHVFNDIVEKTEKPVDQYKNIIESLNNNNDVDISNCCSFNIQNDTNQNKKNFAINSFNEVVSSNVQTFSFLGTNNNANKASSNVISSNTNLNISSSNVNNNLKESSNIKHNQQQFTTSPQMNISNSNLNIKNDIPNNNNNKFNIPMNNNNNMNNFNQPSQNIPNANLNLNTNQDFLNAYQMQMSSILAQNMVNAGLNPQQQLYPMPVFYYPPNMNAGTSNPDPNLNYNNFLPYMGYPMGYYLNPQQLAQQQQGNNNVNLKDANDLQNKNRKINNSYEYNSQQQIPQNTPYAPYFYMNSQYPYGTQNQMSGMNPSMGMNNMMGYNFDPMNNINPLNQMNMNANYDPQNFNQKK